MKPIYVCCLLLLIGTQGSLAWARGPFPATGTYDVYFTPWDNAEGALLAAIGASRKSIHVQAYTLSSRSLAKALVAAAQRGVSVLVLADANQIRENRNSLVSWLAQQGVPVYLETLYVNAHNKVMLIDAQTEHPTVITGSYNFTYSAQAKNAENLLVLRGDRALARLYLENWQRHRADAHPFADSSP